MIILRSTKGSNLTPSELDGNFIFLLDKINYLEGTSLGGSVTSVGLTESGGLYTVSNSPITGAGNISISLATRAANLIFAGPSSGGAASPTFRSLVVNDLPIVTTAKGGTGLSSIGSANTILGVNAGATSLEYKSFSAGSGISITPSAGNFSFSVNESQLNLGNIPGTVSIAKGGSGQTTANAALNAFLPNQSGNSGKVLTTDGANTSWTTLSVGISSLNGLTGGSQTFSNGTSGGALSVSSSGSVHTIQSNPATNLSPGHVSTSNQDFAGVKRFIDGIKVVGPATGEIPFFDSELITTDASFSYDPSSRILEVGATTSKNKHKITSSETLDYTKNTVAVLMASASQSVTLPEIDSKYLGMDFLIFADGNAGTRHFTIRPFGAEEYEGVSGGSTLVNTDYGYVMVRLVERVSGGYMWKIVSKEGTA